MLQAIRSKATSFVVKVLFGLLIVSFGIWGIGDIFRTGGPDTTVAKVGSHAISADQVSQAVQAQIDRLRGVFGGSIDAEQAKQLGVVDQAVKSLVNQNLIDLEVDRMGLGVGSDAVRSAILANPAFHNQAGLFDRNVYEQVLAANHLTDAQYEAMARGDLLKQQLGSALVDGVSAPKALVDALYRSRDERRVADVVTLPPAAAGTVPQPSEAQLDEYYRAHPDRFQSPERRSFKAALLRISDIAASIAVSDDELKKAYDQRQDEFHTPEQREVEQMLLPDEATAKTAAAQLASGKDFAAVAKDVAKMDDPKSLDLGWVKRDDLPPDLANAAFAVKEGGTTAPVKSSFGWHILRVTAVKPASEKSFADAKAQLKQEIASDQAGDHMADVANNIDDAMAGGASFEAVAQKFALKVVTADKVDHDGKPASGAAPDFGKGQQDVLKTAFTTNQGQTSELTEMGDDGYFIVQVSNVAPAATEPLSDVHDQAVTLWQDEARQQALQKAADALVAAVNGGKSLKDAAAAQRLTVTTTQPLLRTGGDTQVPPALVAKLFDAKPGAAVSEPGPNGIVVAALDKIVPADPATDAAGVKDLSQQLDQSLQNDTVAEYNEALRGTFPVSIDQQKLSQILQ